MDNIRIHFHGICTHLVNGSPHAGAPQDIRLEPIHRREPHPPLRHRVLLPWSKDLPEHLKDRIPEHYPRLRYRTGDLTPLQEWNPEQLPDNWWEVDMTHVAVWFRGIDESKGDIPAARELQQLPSVWQKTATTHPKPLPDPAALNGFHPGKVAAYVDLFGDHKLQRLDVKPVINEVIATLQINDTPCLIWTPFGSDASTIEIRPGATIGISNAAKSADPCGEIDYLLHYRATLLDLWQKPSPEWEPALPGPDGAFCSSSTYP